MAIAPGTRFVGTVEAAKRADLLLLDANPLQDIAATTAIGGVVLRGRWLPRTELDSMLDAVAEGFARPAEDAGNGTR